LRVAFRLKPGGGPSLEPISVLSAVSHLQYVPADQHQRLTDIIKGARADAEIYLGRGLMRQTWVYQQDVWSDEIQLPMAAPLHQVVEVKYYDGTGAFVSLDPSFYLEDTLSEPGRIHLAPLKTWPALQANRPMAVQVEYIVGWESPADVPPNILEGLYHVIADRYENRGSTDLPDSAKNCWSDRVFWNKPRCAA
jgi:uncharacterized phiE125 gp8 family phage protein